MKDAEARARLDKLDALLLTLPAAIAEAVLADLQPTIDSVNAVCQAATEQAETLTSLVQRVGEQAEILELLESEGNTLRESVTALSDATESAASKVSRIVAGLGELGELTS